MKSISRGSLVGTVLGLAMVLFLSAPCLAAWDIDETVFYNVAPWKVVKLACTSDGAGTDYQLTTTGLIGRILYKIRTDPGDGADAPTGVYTLDFEDDLNGHMVDLDGRSTTAIEYSAGDITIGVFPPITRQPSVVLGTLGDGNKTDVYLWFLKVD